MNKASAVGFGIGVVVLFVMTLVFGLVNPRSELQNSGKRTGVDAGRSPGTRRMPAFAPKDGEQARKGNPQGGALRIAHSATPGGYRTGQVFDVIVGLDCHGQEKVTALALVERLPKGWTFEEVSGGEKPVIAPSKGAAGELTFVWVRVPAFPCTVSYRVVPGPEVSGPQEFQGQAVYRQSGPELKTEPVGMTVQPATP
jgi:hypothetical protein